MEYLTQSEVEKVLRKAWKASPRDHLMLLLAFRHGLRVSEVASLRVGAVSDGLLTVRRAKGSLKTTQPLKSSANPVYDEPSAFQAWVREKSDEESLLDPQDRPLFGVTDRQVRRIMTDYMVEAGVSREMAHPHALKHACGSLMYRNGADIVAVAQFLGHKDIKNTRIYINMTDAEASAAAAKAFSKMEAQ